MEELIEKLNEECECDFHFSDLGVYECNRTCAKITKDFGEYEIETLNGTLRFREFDFEHGKFRAFVLGTTVFEIYQDYVKKFFRG